MSNGKKISDHHDDALIAEYIQRFGNAASIGLFDPLCKIFNHSSIDGIIGYHCDQHCAVVIGDPVCDADDRIELAKAFNDFCHEQNKKSVYVITSESFTNEILDSFGCSAFQFGHEIVIDPSIDTRTLTGPYPSHLRQKIRHAVSNGVTVGEYHGENPEMENAMIAIAHEWLAHRKGPQVYLTPIDVFAHRSRKRWFYAQKDDQIIGLIVLNRMDSYQGWLLNGNMISPQAPHSTSEFLMMYVLDTLRGEECECLSIGPAVAHEMERIEGFGRLSQIMLNYGFKTICKILKMHTVQRYWKKFQPHKEPLFVVFTSRGGIHLKEIRSLLRALNVKI